MYLHVIRQLDQSLAQLDLILGKAEAHAVARKFNPDNYLTARLAPDMLPFVVQVRIACDIAKNVAAQVVGQVPPKHEDTETTFAEVRERIGKCRTYVASVLASDAPALGGDKLVPVTYPPGKFMTLANFVLTRQIPNFYFHVTTAYALLRGAGVEIGKGDYLGTLELLDG